MVRPPSKALDVKYDTFTVNVATGDTLIFKSGTTIIIPPQGIVKANGEMVKSTKLVYREFQNQSDILVSGIPMIYDSAGIKLPFESGGMFELKSIEKDEIINQNKKIEVNMISSYNQSKNNWYYLNEQTGNWNYIKPVVTTPINTVKDTFTNLKEVSFNQRINLNSVSKLIDSFKMPTKPRLKNPEAYTFKVDVPYLPELAIYQNVEFEVLPNQGFDSKKLPEFWDMIYLKAIDNSNIYLLTLVEGKTKRNFKVLPVFENEEELNKALAIFKSQTEAIKKEKLLFEKNQKEEEKKQQIIALEEEKKRALDEEKRLVLEKNKRLILDKANNQNIVKNNTSNRQEIIRQGSTTLNQNSNNNEVSLNDLVNSEKANFTTMTVSISLDNFGFFNCDKILSSEFIQAEVLVQLNVNEKLQGQIFQYFLKRNAVVTYYNVANNSKYKLNCAKNETCLLIAILEDGNHIAILSPEEFETIVLKERTKQIALSKVDKFFNNSNEIQAWIKENYY